MGLAVDQGDPDVDHRIAGQHPLLQLGPDALLHRRDELPRHRPADHLLRELDPGAAFQRLDLQPADRVLAVPARLLDQPALQRPSAARTSRGTRSAPAPPPPRRASRPAARSSSLSTWAGPMAHSTTWWVSALCSSRMVTSSATSRCRADTSFSSSSREVAWIATGSSGSGSSQGSTSAGRLLLDKVSEVSAAASLETSTRSPAMARGFGRASSPSGADRGPARSSSLSWSGWPVDDGARRSAAGDRRRAAGCRRSACRRTPGPARAGRRTGRWWSAPPRRPADRRGRRSAAPKCSPVAV